MGKRDTLLLLLVSLLLLVACGDATDVTEEPAAPDEAPEAAPEETDADPQDETLVPDGDLSIVWGFPSEPEFAHLPILMTFDRLNEAGWDLSFELIGDTAVLTSAILTGDVHLVVGAPADAVNLVERGSAVSQVAQRSGNDWIVVSSDEFASCDDLDGRRVGYQSETAASTAMLLSWANNECSPDAEPEYLVMAGSSNRAVALIDGQLDATILRIEHWLQQYEDGTPPAGAHVLADMGEALPLMTITTFVLSDEYIEENRDAVVALVAEVMKSTRMVAEDAEALRENALRYLPDVDETTIDLTVEEFISRGLFMTTVDGGLSPDHVEFTLRFLHDEVGVIGPGHTPEDVADFSIIEDALELVGGPYSS